MSLIFLEFTALLNKFAIISECSDASKKIPYLYINSGRPDCPAAAAVIQGCPAGRFPGAGPAVIRRGERKTRGHTDKVCPPL